MQWASQIGPTLSHFPEREKKMHGHRNFALGQAGANFSEPLYNKSSGKSCHEVITISNESTIPRSFLTGKMAYYVLSSILAMGILVSGTCQLSPSSDTNTGSTFFLPLATLPPADSRGHSAGKFRSLLWL